jgi:excinuclease ABC subunit C
MLFCIYLTIARFKFKARLSLCSDSPNPRLHAAARRLQSFSVRSTRRFRDRIEPPEGTVVQSLFPRELFSGFGPSQIHPPGFAPGVAAVHGRRTKRLRAGVRADAPRLPGVYGMIDRRGQLIYVGKAKLLRARLMSYFRVKSRDPKAGRIVGRSAAIVWETAPDEFGALIRELELIRRFRPRFNVLGQPGNRRYIFICIGRPPAPYAFATQDPTGKELAVYGPLVGAAKVRDAVRRLNDAFRLRDCSQQQTMRFAEQRDLFALELAPGCLRYDIGACLGPCAGFCSQRDYAKNVNKAREFLDGKDRSLLCSIEAEMLDASRRMEYERAMSLRDKLADLRWLTDRLVWLKNARQDHSFVYPLQGPDARTVWYLIERGQVRGAVYPPADGKSAKAVAKLIDGIYIDRKATSTMMPHGQVDSVLLVAAWFRKWPHERAKCLGWDVAMSPGIPSNKR